MLARKSFGRLGNRNGARMALHAAAALELPHRNVSCEIEDVSRSGVRLRVERLPRPGTPALLRFGRIEAMGAIVWARGDRCALRFDRPLAPEAMARLQWIADNRERYAEQQLGSASEVWR